MVKRDLPLEVQQKSKSIEAFSTICFDHQKVQGISVVCAEMDEQVMYEQLYVSDFSLDLGKKGNGGGEVFKRWNANE